MNRRILLEGNCNMRDLGGLKTKSGTLVKRGLLYRSDDLSALTAKDLLQLEALHLSTIIDLRSEREIMKQKDRLPMNCTYLNWDPNADMAAMASAKQDHSFTLNKESALTQMCNQYMQFVTSTRSQTVYKNIVQSLLSEEKIPMLFHCRGGKDRTGYATMLIYLLLGVSMEDIMKDFEYTDICRSKRNELRMVEYRKSISDETMLQGLQALQQSNPMYLQTSNETILKEYQSFEKYRSVVLGVDDQMLDQIKIKYLEG